MYPNEPSSSSKSPTSGQRPVRGRATILRVEFVGYSEVIEVETSAVVDRQLRYQEYDRIAIPEDVPALGIGKGDEGVIRGLSLHNETVFAFAMITYSTCQRLGGRGAQTTTEGLFVYGAHRLYGDGPVSTHQQIEQCFLRVQSVLGLIEDPAPRTVYDLSRDLLAPVRRQTVQEDGVFGRKVN
jgi:hypothetical protein